MSYKKCKNDQYWCQCKKRPCKHEPEVIYYECRDSKPESNKCDKYIKETKCLIEKLECKNEKLGEELNTASVKQVQAATDIEELKCDLKEIADTLAKLQSDLDVAKGLLNDAIDKVKDDIIPNQEGAVEAIKDAKETQGQIEGIIECLEDSFRCTVKCLKENCSGGSCPILVPKKSCYNEWEDRCDCEEDDYC